MLDYIKNISHAALKRIEIRWRKPSVCSAKLRELPELGQRVYILLERTIAHVARSHCPFKCINIELLRTFALLRLLWLPNIQLKRVENKNIADVRHDFMMCYPVRDSKNPRREPMIVRISARSALHLFVADRIDRALDNAAKILPHLGIPSRLYRLHGITFFRHIFVVVANSHESKLAHSRLSRNSPIVST